MVMIIIARLILGIGVCLGAGVVHLTNIQSALAQTPQAAINQQTEKIKIVFLGDSLTEGYGVAKEASYPSLIERQLKEKDIQVEIVNAGISGSTTASAVSRLQWQLRTAWL
jgi:lysophospholipase L1-like esterase